MCFLLDDLGFWVASLGSLVILGRRGESPSPLGLTKPRAAFAEAKPSESEEWKDMRHSAHSRRRRVRVESHDTTRDLTALLG